MAIQVDKTNSEKLALNLLKRYYRNEKGRNPTVDLLIDGTVLPKRGKYLPKVGLHYEHKDKKFKAWVFITYQPIKWVLDTGFVDQRESMSFYNAG